MNIKLGENLSVNLKPLLLWEGHEAATAEEEGLLGLSDVRVAAAAKAEGRMLFTLDLEFADLRKFPPGSHAGVILFRPKSMGPSSVNAFVMSFVKGADLSGFVGCVVVVDRQRIRVRRPVAGKE